MKVVHSVDIDVQNVKTQPVVDAVRGEVDSREIKINLLNGYQNLSVPPDVQCMMSYRKPDGTGGLYDVLPSGETAYEVGTTYITAKIAPQVLSVSGEVSFSVNLMKGDQILNTFPLIINVEDNPGLGLAESKDYFGLSAAISMAVNTATTARYLISVTKQDDGTLISNATVEALDSAYEAKKIIMCYYAGYLYYLTGIATESGSHVYIFNSHASNGVSRFLNVGKTVTEQNLDLKNATFVVSANYSKETNSYSCSHTADEIAEAYRNRKSIILFYQSYLYPLVGIYEDSNGWVAKFAMLKTNGILTEFLVFSGNSIDFINEKVLIGDSLNVITPCNYSNFSVFKSFGVIGDSLSRGVYRDAVLPKNVEDLNQSWGNFLARACGNQHVSLGFSGATTATWLRDRLETLKAADCDVYILALGYNDSLGNVRLGFIDDITGSDTMVDKDGIPQVYGTYYFNVEKILRKINEFHPNAKTFVLTNPSFENRDDSYVYDYNKALRNIVAKYGAKYHAYLVDLADTYDFVFKTTENDRELQHFHAQMYNYFAQVISSAIGHTMMEHPVAFEDFLNAKPAVEKYIPETYSINLFNPNDSRNRSSVFIDVVKNQPVYSPYSNDMLGVTHPIRLEEGVAYKVTHPTAMGGVFRVARVDTFGNIVQSYSKTEDGQFYSDHIQISTDSDGLKFLIFTPPSTDLYSFNFCQRYRQYAQSNEAFMVCRLEDFPTEKVDGILRYIPFERRLTDKVDASNIIGLVNSIRYINITAVDASTANSDTSFEEIVDMYSSGQDVKCRFEQYVLPLCFITANQVVFGGATGNVTAFVSQTSDGAVEYSIRELADKKDVPTKQEFDALKKQVESSTPGGGGGGNVSYYETSFVTDEDYNQITFTLPVDAVKFYMWKLSYRTPDTGVTDKRTVYLYFGGGFYNLGPTDNFGCVSLAGMRHIPNHFVVSKNTRNDSNMEHCGAGFLHGSGNVDAEDGRNDVSLTTPNNIAFPTGTEVWFWGVYHK